MGCGASASPVKPPPSELSLRIEQELAEAGWLKSPGKGPDGLATPKSSKAASPQAATKDSSQDWTVDQSISGGAGANRQPVEPPRKHSSVMKSEQAFERALSFASKIPMFKNIHPHTLPLIVKAMETHEYAMGEVVIQQGELTDKLFMILSGDAEVVRKKGEGPEVKLATLTQGDYFGETELMLAGEARATVRVIGREPLNTYSIAHDVFFKLDLKERLHIPKRHAIVGLREAQQAILEDVPTQLSKVSITKSEADHSFLLDALRSNTYLPSQCDAGHLDEVLEKLVLAAIRCTASAGEVLFKEGDPRVDRFFIIESGSFDFAADHQEDDGFADKGFADMAGSFGVAFGTERKGSAGSWHASHGKKGGTFGEMEVFLGLPARATVTALEESVYWAIGRTEIKEIFAQQSQERLGGYVEALRSVQVFSKLYPKELMALAHGVVEMSYQKDEEIVVQREVSDACYVLIGGEAEQIRDGEKTGKKYSAGCEQGIGNFFGSKELINPGPRCATVRVVSEMAKVLCIDRETFQLILAPLEEILRGDRDEGSASGERVAKVQDAAKELNKQFEKNCKLQSDRIPSGVIEDPVKREDLEFIGNLGAGQFGVVDLAVEKGTGRRFAFKQLHAKNFKEPWHIRQVKMERSILMMTCSPFLVRLYASYKEPRSLAFLMELVTGGDLRHALYRDKLIKGNEDCARFYCAGIVLAVEHLHERHIVHRDLKPDNVLLDDKGWPKVTDFGLAKFCVGKTYTLSGTPNYMAPESFQAAGHGLAVDWWSLGCLTYELMAGKTPFQSPTGNFQELFRKINRGIKKPDLFPWPKCFSEHMPRFLFCLLQNDPTMRLPMRRSGIAKLQAHAWYESAAFEWPAFKDRLLQAPIIPPSLGSLKPGKSLEASVDIDQDNEGEGIDWDDVF